MVYSDKTGNSWGQKDDDFVKHAGKFYPLDIDYGQEETVRPTVGTGTNSKLAPEVQDLVKMIFDVESMKKAMMEFEVQPPFLPSVSSSPPSSPSFCLLSLLLFSSSEALVGNIVIDSLTI